MLGISAPFAKYFTGENVNPKKDMLLMTTCTLTLNDDEFTKFLSEINDVALKYMNVEMKKESKTRQITLISSPINEQVK